MATLHYGTVVGAGPGWTQVTTPTGTKTVYGDRATRNNNPGNIEAGNYANNAGAIGTDGRFAVFGDRAVGARAQAGLIFGANYRNLTLREAIAKYAPSFENNTAAYAEAVAAAAGVSLDTKMKDIPEDRRAAVVAGMQAVEGNTTAKAYDEFGNLTDTLDTVSKATPDNAPTPYGPNSPQALGSIRPDNFSFAGPKGLFSVDSQVASPIGHVTRSPLGPAAPSYGGVPSPSRPDNASFAGPKGSFSVGGVGPAAPSTPSAKSPDRPDNHNYSGPVGMGGPGGTYVDKASAAAATAATHAAASAERAASSGQAPSISAPSPSRPDTLGGLNYGAPKGVFSVDPSAKVQASISPAMGPAAPAAPVGVQARPAIAAPTASVPAVTVAPPAPRVAVPAVPAVAPPTPSYSRQAIAPARPALSAADVYGGTIGTAQTSTPGTTVSRATSFGPTYTTNKFGAVTATAPDGTQMAAWGGVPSKPAISGPLGNTGISTPSTVGGMFGPKAKAATGTIAGAAIGGYALGPLGAALGGLIGKNLAQGKAPLSGILGGSTASPGTRTVDTYAGKMTAANPVGGLGFPSAPAAPKNTYSGPKGGSGGLSKAARDALSGSGGLF